MAPFRGPVLLDTNVIIEAFRVSCWPALSGGYRLETVEECVVETQTGFQRRRPDRRIDADQLRSRLAGVHTVAEGQLALVAIEADGLALDAGEAALWAHALDCPEAWILCGPDKASLRFGLRQGYRERLVALEWLLGEIGCRSKLALGEAYTAYWLRTTLGQLTLLEEPRRT
ncbi:MAG: hypothetical protein GVY13_15230 [Alphaproteobacteria bacterium]|jgi:hypothetical protein|nr:hypothetical protein [Alphaproteobacteria bacterium]